MTTTDTTNGTLIDLNEPTESFAAMARSHPFRHSHLLLLQELLALSRHVPELSNFPTCEEFESLNDYQRAIAVILDRWHLRFWQELKCNTNAAIDRADFDHQFTSAIEGMATFEVERIVEQMREDEEDERKPSRYAGEDFSKVLSDILRPFSGE